MDICDLAVYLAWSLFAMFLMFLAMGIIGYSYLKWQEDMDMMIKEWEEEETLRRFHAPIKETS